MSYHTEHYRNKIRKIVAPEGDGNSMMAVRIKSLSDIIRKIVAPEGDGNPPPGGMVNFPNVIRKIVAPEGDGNKKRPLS